ncbi:MAG: N-acetylmuramoyl-L-alanine amidase [Chloroflexales bacterium]|nr:N-acetylmuramoyl-L-alanine amidase [Chloroflexales bacterium]
MLLSPRRLLAPLAVVALLLGLAASRADAIASADPATGIPDQAVLVTATDVPAADAGILATADAGYLSPVTEAPHPFTHVLLRWEASEPASETLMLELRASLDGVAWTDWGTVAENPDLWMPADGELMHWGQEIYAGEGMRFWQVRAQLAPAPDGRLPELHRVDVNTVDARFGPASPSPDEGAQLAAVGKPPVVSRTGWGSPDGQGSRVSPVYYPVKHMVVHHTADSNSLSGGQSWSDRVRAIWSFHTFTRGWGDIGYNYLVDPDGVIYEGRAGGDDAVAFHDTANYGSMGVVLIGTYASVDPRPAAVNSLVELLAWKAGQKGIDPLGRSFYYGCAHSSYCNPYNAGGIVENIAGHRQVTPGHTTCPGDRLLNLLPGVRQQVQSRLSGGTPIDNGDLLIDERETSFERSSAQWYEWPCGYGGNTFYTFGTDDPAESANRGLWKPTIGEAGRYQVLAHIPQGCGLGQATSHAVYKIHAADRVYEVTLNQNTGDEWVALGTYQFSAGQGGYVELSDLTGERLIDQRVVYFDSVRWVKEDPAAARLDLLGVRYDRQQVPAGQLLKVTFTVRNSGSVAIEGQAPEAARRPDIGASFDLGDSYVYDEAECFLGAAGQSYPAYPKEAGRFRVLLGPVDAARQPSCAGGTGGYPWRWGINGVLNPGETRDVVGYVLLRAAGPIAVQAGAISEYVDYMALGVGATTITVMDEPQPPAPVAYDEGLRPLASVYRLGEVPDNLLSRTSDATAVTRGAYVGSFVWSGEPRDWGEGGPLAAAPDLTDRFVIEQARSFVAPTSGIYTFQISSDDGAWLWVDGRLVVSNPGLHDASMPVTGTVTLTAGRHALAFKMFERSGGAAASYSLRGPGEESFGPVVDGLVVGASERLGSTFKRLDGLTLAADDLGGGGVARIKVAINGGAWQTIAGPVASLGGLAEGVNTVRYIAVDVAGNESAERTIRVTIDPNMSVNKAHLPALMR